MCYSIEAHYTKQAKEARRKGNHSEAEYFEEKLREIMESPNAAVDGHFYLASGFSFPKLFVIDKKNELCPSSWGLIPHWTKNQEVAKSIRAKTLNSRSETMFEKPSFRDAAKKSRCIIPVSGFYEYHHFGGQAYPYRLSPKNQEQFIFGGLRSEWVNKETGEIFDTFSIVTTQANELMSVIHNNPKAKGPRMPVILSEEKVDQWLYQDIKTDLDKEELLKVCKPFAPEEMQFNNVHKLNGKDAVGNSPVAIEDFEYPELGMINLELKEIVG